MTCSRGYIRLSTIQKKADAHAIQSTVRRQVLYAHAHSPHAHALAHRRHTRTAAITRPLQHTFLFSTRHTAQLTPKRPYTRIVHGPVLAVPTLSRSYPLLALLSLPLALLARLLHS